MAKLLCVSCLLCVSSAACIHRPTSDPDVLVVGIANAPNNLDPRVGSDEASARAQSLMFDTLMALDDHLRVVPNLAERLDNPEPTVYVATLRRGVRFHDGHELTAADVVYTFRSFIDPAFVSPRKGAYRMLASIQARDRYTVVFTLSAPFGSFPVNLVMPIVPDGAGPSMRDHPVGTGPYRFVRYAVDDRLELSAFEGYWGGRPRNAGLVLKIVPDDIMRGLELRKGTVDLVVNDLLPDIVHQLAEDPSLQTIESPGTDYQYLALNLRTPALADVRVRQAIAYAIDRHAIVDYLRRGLARPAVGVVPPMSWAFAPDVFTFTYDPAKARALLDEAGYRDPDGDGPRPRFHLSLKTSTQEYSRLQATVIQQDLEAVGIAVDVRSYEFATMYADVLEGAFEMVGMQWVGVSDPDMLRRVFASSQVPPAGFNRGFFRDPRVDRLIDEATVATDMDRRRRLYEDVQRIVAVEAPYISLWYKTNVAVAQRSLTGIRLLPNADFSTLKDVARRPASASVASN